jgi:hypothetical protein
MLAFLPNTPYVFHNQILDTIELILLKTRDGFPKELDDLPFDTTLGYRKVGDYTFIDQIVADFNVRTISGGEVDFDVAVNAHPELIRSIMVIAFDIGSEYGQQRAKSEIRTVLGISQ